MRPGNKKNYIIATISENYTIENVSNYNVLPLIESCRQGHNLSVTNNAITVGTNINKVKINAMAHFNTVIDSGVKWLTIYKNGIAIMASNETMQGRGSQVLAEKIIDVTEGDTLQLKIQSNSKDVIRATDVYTFLQVQEL